MLKKLLKKSPLIVFLVRKIVQWKNTYILDTDIKKEKFIATKFRKRLGYDIEFNKIPETFNQKIQFRKLYDKNPLYAICADKYAVREYVKEKIGEEYLIPLYLVTDKLTEEQWSQLNAPFVIKPNHDSGTVEIVKDKIKVNAQKIITDINRFLKIDYGKISLEKYYSDIKERKIIVEKYLKDNIEDFKFHVFNMENETKIFIQIDRDRFQGHKRNIYDENFNKLDFKYIQGYEFFENDIKEEVSEEILAKMKELVKKLSQGFEYVRVDLYNVDGKIYFGEMTFCPESGFGDISPVEWDYKLGSYWNQKKLK